MKDARTQALALIHAGEYTPPNIALRSFVFVEEAARLTPKEYSGAERQHVLREHIAAHVRFGGGV